MEIPKYWRTRAERYKDLGKGKIYSFTGNIALVQIVNNKMVTAQLTDFGDTSPHIGQVVECVIRKLNVESNDDGTGLIVYGQKFRPLFSSDAR